MWTECDAMFGGLCIEAEEAGEQWANHHCGRPDLVRRCRGERLIVVAGESLGNMPERSIEGQQSIGAQIGVCRECRVIAILTRRCPAGKQRPDRSGMIAGSVIFRVVCG